MDFQTLEHLFASHQYRQEFSFLTANFERVKKQKNLVELEAIYQQVIRRFEKLIWQNKVPSAQELTVYQKLYCEMEQVISLLDEDNRYHFVIVIPVSDGSRQLKSCLQSIHTLCLLYQYGGIIDGVYKKIDVIIADDSETRENAEKNQRLAEEYSSLGLRCEYFGLEAQSKVLASLNEEQLETVAKVTGYSLKQADTNKGESRTSNFTYLRLTEISREIENPLFFFVDSDQQFLVSINDNGTKRHLHAINYFYHLEHIFREKQIRALTGKVVGNPPASPVVMIRNFLEDVIAFLQRIVLSDPQQECHFHDDAKEVENDAAYHDMAELFGYYPAKKPCDYQCSLTGYHTVEDTLNAFSAELNKFFYGKHPTRVTYYHHDIIRDTVKPSHTLYKCNYVFRPDALEYFIPFATLNFRMAWSVLGRILQNELGDNFVSANTPLLYKCNVDESAESGFSSEVEKTLAQIDLTDEFERQFLGDITLFSVQELLEEHHQINSLERNLIADTVNKTKTEILGKYSRHLDSVMKSLTVLESLLRLTGVEAHDDLAEGESELELTGERFLMFVANVKRNFSQDSDNYALLHDQALLADKCEQIITAIQDYGRDRENWFKLLESYC